MGRMTPPASPAGAGIAQRRALRDEVFDLLMARIAGGGFAPEAPLGIDSLAAELGVSQTPVREALVQLESTGLVVRTALRGYRVAPPLSLAAMEELFDARRIIEVAAAERAMAHREELLPQLRARHAVHLAHAQALANGPAADAEALNTYLQADRAFHEAILQAAHNRFLGQLTQHISTHGHRLRHFVATRLLDGDQAVAEHARILAAFEDGDIDQVRAAMADHIDAVRSRVLEEISDTR